MAHGGNFTQDCWMDTGGDGGVAGKGGKVSVSSTSTVCAYNGDMITNGEYDDIYEYDKDGNKTGTKLEAITYQKNDEGFLSEFKIIPAKIFAQEGILRAVYKTNAYWVNDDERPYREGYSYVEFEKIFGSTISEEAKNVTNPTSSEFYKLICIRKEQHCNVTSYFNPVTSNSQGVGSGAGYIEVSNGTYEIDPALN